MSFIYITGSAGSGKTTIKNELLRLGFEAHDEDDPDIGSAHNKKSGLPVQIPPVGERTPEWFAVHEWKVFPQALATLKERSADNLIFLCGNVATEQQLRELYDKVIFLDITQELMRKRIAAREDNDFGKADYEFQMIITRDDAARSLHQKNKSTFIDASQPLDKVIEEILAVSQA